MTLKNLIDAHSEDIEIIVTKDDAHVVSFFKSELDAIKPEIQEAEIESFKAVALNVVKPTAQLEVVLQP